MTYMNNLLEMALSYEGYTHLRLEMLHGGQRNFIYKDVVMDDLEVHYTLDAIMEEWDYPELTGPIQIYRQKDGVLQQHEIKVYTPD
jgi:hypothetical protein